MQVSKQKIILSGLIIAFLIALDQTLKYLIRLNGGFYICNQNLAFGLKPWLTILFLLIVVTYILICIGFGNSKLKTLNTKQTQNPNIQNSKKSFGHLNLKNFNLFRISDLGFRIFKKNFWPIVLILSGAASNLIDRIYLGCVIDFIDLKFWPASIATQSFAGWPIFNLADIYITVGAIMLLVQSSKFKVKN